MKRLPIILLLLLAASPIQAAVRHVPAAYSTIQAGIEAASEGDTVLVAPGIYTGVGNRDLDFNGKDIVLKGDGAPEEIVIDCEEAGRGIYLHNGESNAATITCLTIIHGAAQSLGSGVFIDSESGSIENVRIHDCFGGGVEVRFSPDEVLIANSFIMGNSVSYSGGGVFVTDSVASLINVTVEGNSSRWGGGVSIGQTVEGSTDVTISDCVIRDNEAWLDGGGLYCNGYQNTTVRIDGIEFLDNSAQLDGGGMFFTGSTTYEIDNCLFQGNHAAIFGGGAVVKGAYQSDPLGPCTMRDCLIVANSSDHGPGGLMATYHFNPVFENLTIVANESTATHPCAVFIGSHAHPEFNNSLIAANTGIGVYVDNTNPVFSCCNVWNNSGGTYGGVNFEDQTGTNGNISENPLFCAGLGGDEPLSLQSDSPCLPENNDCGVLIGALGQGCDTTAVDESTWSEVKSLYK